jgi:metal-sulfur cluster biosynthetic enzyme
MATIELQDKLKGYISENIERRLQEIFKDQNVEVETQLFTQQEEDKASLSINIAIGTKFYDISEAVASNFEMYCDERGLTDEECEKAFQQAYKEELNEINEKFAIPVKGKITMKLNENSEAEIEVYPLECDGDYCIAGLGIHIYVSQIPINWLEQTKDSMIDSITRFIDSIYDLYTSL